MHLTVDVSMEKDILEANRKLAGKNKELIEGKEIKAFEFIGGIGSGKTLIIEGLVDRLKIVGKKVGAIAGDVAGDDDLRRLKEHGIQVENLNTGKECHLDAHLVGHSLEHLDLEQLDVLFIENVGNLVCPADFPLGTDKRVLVVSVSEGDDMVRKHPVIFGLADIVVVNKIDLAEAVEVDPEVLRNDYLKLKPNGMFLFTDAKHGKGLDELLELLVR